MKLSNLAKPLSLSLSLILLATAPLTSATCFTTGLDGDRTKAHAKVGRMCDFLSGPYAPGQAKHHAFSYNDGVIYVRRWDFWITNTQSVAGFNSKEGCIEFLRREINCLKGGETYYPTLGWIFHADPNDGPCVQNCEL